ncbi:MAG: hypothetical protein MHPSP_001713, partial [Paramarteilia canceri]
KNDVIDQKIRKEMSEKSKSEEIEAKSKNLNKIQKSPTGNESSLGRPKKNMNGIWTSPGLVVRNIDKENIYFKKKMKVVDVHINEEDNEIICLCHSFPNTYDFNIEVNQKFLDTCIPKKNELDESRVKIVDNGEFQGAEGQVLELDSEENKALVQLEIDDGSMIIKEFHYDSICLFHF